MNITAKTTKQSILEPVADAKGGLFTLIQEMTTGLTADLIRGEEAVKAAQRVRNAEAVAHVQITYRAVCINSPETRAAFLFNVLAQGADDTWSGRGNDSARAAHDAVRSWAGNQYDDLYYEN